VFWLVNLTYFWLIVEIFSGNTMKDVRLGRGSAANAHTIALHACYFWRGDVIGSYVSDRRPGSDLLLSLLLSSPGSSRSLVIEDFRLTIVWTGSPSKHTIEFMEVCSLLLFTDPGTVEGIA
jgi:hypothetical protein